MICWYCYWGWPNAVMEIYERWLPELGESGLDYGAGHIVWSDENFDAESIQWCIEEARAHGLEREIMTLTELLAVPEEVRCCEPADYDGINPENYPPVEGLGVRRKRRG